MAKTIKTVAVASTEFGDRWRNACDRLEAMEQLLKSKLHDPAAVLAVQAVIAANDAFTIRLLGVRCASERHLDALELLNGIRDVRGLDEGRSHFRRVLDRKYKVEYSGKPMREADAVLMATHARRFCEFVIRHLPA